ncbi:MAG: hypothetical protein AAF401_04715 [Pseudomonadota bacterium]
MKTGASVSGVMHAVAIGALIIGGELFAEREARAINIAEVELMTGTEFDAALSVAPDYNPDLPAAPRAPEEGERADVEVAKTDAALAALTPPEDPDAPEPGEAVKPLEEVAPAAASIVDVGDRPAAPLAPEGDALISAEESPDEFAPIAERATTPSPSPRPSPQAPEVETTTPEEAPEPEVREVADQTAPEVIEDTPAPTPSTDAVEIARAPETPAPSPSATTPQIDTSSPSPPPVEPVVEDVAEETPEPEEPVEEEVVTLNDPSIPAPKLAPPPRSKPKDIAEAKKAERLAKAAEQAKEQGATQRAQAATSTGSSRTVGRLSSRDKDNLRVGIKSFFNPPTGLANANQLAVKIRIALTREGKIQGKPEVRSPSGRLDPQHSALMRAGMRALQKSAAAGVFRKLPADKYDRWRLIDVTFTPREIQFL